MKKHYFPLLAALLCLSSGCSTLAGASELKYPTASDLQELVGTPVDSDKFKSFVTEYSLSQFHKDKNSWGSRCGVFITGNTKVVAIGLRPKSKGNGTSSFYPGKLPFNLEPRDNLKSILKKVGKPISLREDGASSRLGYSDFIIEVMWDELFEVWFHEKHDYTKPTKHSYRYKAVKIDGEIFLKPLYSNADPFGPFSLVQQGVNFVLLFLRRIALESLKKWHSKA